MITQVTKKELFSLLKRSTAIRVGYNAIVYQIPTDNGHNIGKLTDYDNFTTEVLALHHLGPADVSPKLLNAYWCNEPVKIQELVYAKAFALNKNIRPKLDWQKMFEPGVGLIVMEPILNPTDMYLTDTGALRNIAKHVHQKLAKGYLLGFLPLDPVVLVSRVKNEYISRIVDWSGAKRSPPSLQKLHEFINVAEHIEREFLTVFDDANKELAEFRQ